MFGTWLIASAAILIAPADPPSGPAERLEEANREAWKVIDILLPKLTEKDDADRGLKGFVAEVRKARGPGAAKAKGTRTPAIDVDALVTRNPAFWRAQYEVAPGDPGWLLLHGALLLAGGEATRAQAVLILARQRNDLPTPIQFAVQHLIGQASRVLKDGNAAVEAGIAEFDRGDLDAALKTYRAAVAAWPGNGWAHFEIGLTLMTKEAKARNVEIPAGISGRKAVEPSIQTADVLAAFAESRRHDPFQWKAYQGKSDEARPRLQALSNKVLPTWQILARGETPADAPLSGFSEGLQEAGVDDLALVARQMIVSRRGRFSPADHPFIATSLRRLAPGPESEEILRRLGSEKIEVRQIVKPEPPQPPRAIR